MKIYNFLFLISLFSDITQTPQKLCLQFLFYLNLREGLNDVAYLDVVEVDE